METLLPDGFGSHVTVGVVRADPISAYVVKLADGSIVGRAEFIDSPADGGERIFFHTEVNPEFGGRGLAGLILREALEDSIRDGVEVVPVCPLFARHLARHGSEFVATGGRFRAAVRDDSMLVGRVIRKRA